jgi:hypothetical protein
MAARRPPTVLTATGLAAVPVVLLGLPWWTPPPPVLLVGTGPAVPGPDPAWSGWELVGPPRGLLLGALLVAGFVALLAGVLPAARVLLVLAGAAAVVIGVEVVLDRGLGISAGLTVAAGAATAVLSATGAPLLLGVAVLAVVIPLLPGGPRATAPDAQAGGFQLIARLDAGEPRSGAAGLPAAGAAAAVIVDGRPGVVTPAGLAVADEHGRAWVLARTPDGPPDRPAIIGAAGGRVLRWTAADAVTVTALDPNDPVAVTVTGVGAVSRLGADGTAWVRAVGDPPGAARRLDLAQRDGEQRPDATYLPVVTINPPSDSAPVDVETVLPVGDGAVRVVPQETGQRLERLTSTAAADTEVTPLAGGLDPRCGLTSSGPASFLSHAGQPAAGPEGALWFTADAGYTTLLTRLAPDGTLRAVAGPLPGRIETLAVEPTGAVVVTAQGPDGPGLWRLPDPAAALVDLPAPPPGCTPPAQAAPGVTLVPVARTGHDVLGVPLGADGRWAAGGTDTAGEEVAVVAPNGTHTSLGAREEGATGFVPDGTGGIWWWEPRRLVHADRSGVQRGPAVDVPGDRPVLVPDLSGRPPLLATDAGAFRIDSGTPVPVVEGPVAGGVVRADGRGWLVAGGRLLALDGDRVLGPVIDAGERPTDPTPVAVQLAHGTAPAALALPRAVVALDVGGRAVVIADDVVLAAGDDGAVRVVAQDRRLVGLPVTAAEGGLVAIGRGELLRVDLPG